MAPGRGVSRHLLRGGLPHVRAVRARHLRADSFAGSLTRVTGRVSRSRGDAKEPLVISALFRGRLGPPMEIPVVPAHRRSRFPRGDDRRRRLSLTFARGHQPELGQDGQTQGGAEPIPKTDCSPASTLACSSSSVWPDSRRPMAGTSPIIFGAPFGCGIVVVFLAVLTYLVDSYTVYVASVLAANSVVRSLFGAAFPL